MSFENFITTLDTHEGSITGFATLLLVVVTLGLVYINLRLWRAQDRPYLEFRFEPANENNKKPFNFYIKNIGKGPAIDITFETDNKNYTRKSLGFKEEILLDSGEFSESMKYTNGVKNIRYKDINGFKIKHDSIEFGDMCVIRVAYDGIV